MQCPSLQKASPGSVDMFLQSDVFLHGISVSILSPFARPIASAIAVRITHVLTLPARPISSASSENNSMQFAFISLAELSIYL